MILDGYHDTQRCLMIICENSFEFYCFVSFFSIFRPSFLFFFIRENLWRLEIACRLGALYLPLLSSNLEGYEHRQDAEGLLRTVAVLRIIVFIAVLSALLRRGRVRGR